jgi:galactokinase
MTTARATAVVAEFRSRFGREPDGVFTAPGRVNLIGEHTDYNEGFVLPVAIDRSAVVAAAVRDDGVVSGWSAQLGAGDTVRVDVREPASAAGWIGYAAGVVWALQAVIPAGFGLDVVVDSDVAVGAGLSSSAALACAVALAVAELSGAAVDRVDLARAAQRAEHEVVGAPVGLMDQAVSLLAEPDTALFLDCRTLQTRAVPFRPSDAGLALVVIDTRVRHAHATGGYAERRRDCAEAASLLGVRSLRGADPSDVVRLPSVLARRARHVVNENARVEQAVACLDDGDVHRLGPLLVASHRSLRDDFEVSVAELDVAVDAAVDGGAVGARMTGGGFGGSVLALVPQACITAVAKAVAHAFGSAGFGRPDVFAVQVTGGAHRLEPV